jgi:hypothetical protein
LVRVRVRVRVTREDEYSQRILGIVVERSLESDSTDEAVLNFNLNPNPNPHTNLT